MTLKEMRCFSQSKEKYIIVHFNKLISMTCNVVLSKCISSLKDKNIMFLLLNYFTDCWILRGEATCPRQLTCIVSGHFSL